MGIFNSEIINERFKQKMASIPIAAPPNDDPINITDPDNIKFSAIIWSDLHFSAIYDQSRAQSSRTSMVDLSASSVTLDALLIAGDLCENGKQVEKDYLAEQLQSIKTVKTVLPASGNHDVRLRHIENSIKKFSSFCYKINNDLLLNKMYYSREVNGYKIIILGTTRTKFEECYLDNAEMDWLDNELRSGTAEGKPVFVIAHQPLQNTHNLPHAWDTPGNKRKGSIGKQSEHLKNILSCYNNVFFITGHLHRGFNINTYEDVINIHSINAPSTGVWNKDSIYSGAGMGFIMEVYENFVLFRPRDFINGKFIPEYNKKYNIL